jgi:hypothetical protein
MNARCAAGFWLRQGANWKPQPQPSDQILQRNALFIRAKNLTNQSRSRASARPQYKKALRAAPAGSSAIAGVRRFLYTETAEQHGKIDMKKAVSAHFRPYRSRNRV